MSLRLVSLALVVVAVGCNSTRTHVPFPRAREPGHAPVTQSLLAESSSKAATAVVGSISTELTSRAVCVEAAGIGEVRIDHARAEVELALTKRGARVVDCSRPDAPPGGAGRNATMASDAAARSSGPEFRGLLRAEAHGVDYTENRRVDDGAAGLLVAGGLAGLGLLAYGWYIPSPTDSMTFSLIGGGFAGLALGMALWNPPVIADVKVDATTRLRLDLVPADGGAPVSGAGAATESITVDSSRLSTLMLAEPVLP